MSQCDDYAEALHTLETDNDSHYGLHPTVHHCMTAPICSTARRPCQTFRPSPLTVRARPDDGVVGA